MKTPNRKIVLLLTTMAVLFMCAIPSIAQITIAPSGGLHYFDGAANDGWAPPDPNAAVGPNHIVEVVNNSMVIFNKSGGVISSKDLNTFFSAATRGDPHVVYDEISQQFLVEDIWLDGSGNMIGVCFASSASSDPTGSWSVMYISVPGFWDGYGGNAIGYNADAYVVHVNGFNNQFAVIPVRSNTYTLVTAPSGIRIGRPAPMPGSVGGGSFYFVEGSDDGVNGQGGTPGNVEVVRVNNIASNNRSFNDYQVNVNNSGVSVVNVSWRNNQLAIVGDSANSVQWELLSTSGTPSLLQNGSISSPDGGVTLLPSVSIDPNGDLGVNYASITGSGMTMYVSGRGAFDSNGTMRGSVAAAAAAKSDGRIGDYSSCVVDVNSSGVAQNTFWACGEWMNTTSSFDWRTRLTQFAMLPTAGYTQVTGEGGTVNFSVPADLAYGANGSYFYLYSQVGSVTFNPATFGGDPNFGVVKSGYARSYVQGAGEGGSATFATPVEAAYGAQGKYFYIRGIAGTVAFNANTFGGDPNFGVSKAGYYMPYTLCAGEGGSATFSSPTDVAYGANGHYYFLYGVTGTIAFNPTTFGGDPAFGVVKAGYFRPSGPTLIPGVYTIKSYGDSGTALQGTLDAYWNGSSYASGIYEVAVTPYSAGWNYQQWTVTPIGNGQYHVINKAENLSLQSTGDAYRNAGGNVVGGANKIALTPNYWNIANQVWLFNPGTGYSLANPANSQNLQASGDSYRGLSGCYQVLGSPYAWGVGTYQEWNLVWVNPN